MNFLSRIPWLTGPRLRGLVAGAVFATLIGVSGIVQQAYSEPPTEEYTELYFLNPDKMFPTVYNGFHMKFVIANRTNDSVLYTWQTWENGDLLQSEQVRLGPGGFTVVVPDIWNLPPGNFHVTLKGLPHRLDAILRGPEK